VGACLHRELDVVVRAGRADLDEHGLLPVRDLAQLVDLDLEVVGPRPVRVSRGAPLVDALRQRAHLRDAVRGLVAEGRPAFTRLRALADDDLDRVRLAQVVRIHAVARREKLVDERRRVLALLGRHAAVTCRGRRANLGRAAAESLLRGCRERAEAHPRDRDRDPELERLLREARSEDHVGGAALAVALERVARDRRTEEEKIVEVRQPALRAEAANVVDPFRRSALDLGDDGAVEEVRLAEVPAARLRRSHQYAAALSTLNVYSWRADPYRRKSAGSTSISPGSSSARSRARWSSRRSFSTPSAPRLAAAPRADPRAP